MVLVNPHCKECYTVLLPSESLWPRLFYIYINIKYSYFIFLYCYIDNRTPTSGSLYGIIIYLYFLIVVLSGFWTNILSHSEMEVVLIDAQCLCLPYKRQKIIYHSTSKLAFLYGINTYMHKKQDFENGPKSMIL